MNNRFSDLIEFSGIAEYFPADIKMFTQCQIEDLLEISNLKADINQILCVKSSINIISTKILQTPESRTWDENMMTGKNLLIEGDVINIVEYISSNASQKVLNNYFIKPFSSYITLEANYNEDLQHSVAPYIEDIYILRHDKEHLYINVMFILAIDM